MSMYISGLPGLLQVQSGYGWRMHDGGHMMGLAWGPWGLVHGLFSLLIFAAIVVIAFVLVRQMMSGGQKTEGESRPTALDQLDERYARGEIDREEYLQRKKDISER